MCLKRLQFRSFWSNPDDSQESCVFFWQLQQRAFFGDFGSADGLGQDVDGDQLAAFVVCDSAAFVPGREVLVLDYASLGFEVYAQGANRLQNCLTIRF